MGTESFWLSGGKRLLSRQGEALRKFVNSNPQSRLQASDSDGGGHASADRQWFAVFTIPQNEKSAARHLSLRDVESFLPTYHTVHVWKNRQRVPLSLPLFPSYLFVRISRRERGKVLGSPGVLRIVGNPREPLPVPDSTIEFLRSDLCASKAEPFHELVVGQKVRIRSGAMSGLQGVLVRKNNHFRFVLSVDLINQHAAVEIGAENLEALAS